MRIQFLTLLLFISAAGCFCQAPGQFIIKAGKLFDSETGTFKANQWIYVKGNLMEEVKEEKDVAMSDTLKYKFINLGNLSVLPGLIDAHTHLLYKEIVYTQDVPAGLDLVNQLTMDGESYRAIYGAAKAKGYLEHGVTAVQDLGNSGMYGDIALRRAINENLVPGPRMRCAGRGLSAVGGQVSGLLRNHQSIVDLEYRVVKNPDDGRQAVRENITQGADVIKIYADNSPNKAMLSIDEIKAIVQEASRYGIRVTAHAQSNTSVWNAVTGGVNAIEHGSLIDDSTLLLMKQRNVALIPTDGDSLDYASYSKLKWPGDTARLRRFVNLRKGGNERLKRAHKAGVTIIAGSDDYTDIKLPFGLMPLLTIIAYQEGGLTIPEALKTATINAAYHLRWGNRIGVIKKRYFADIIAVEGNLEENLKVLLNTRFVMKDGKVYVHQ